MSASTCQVRRWMKAESPSMTRAATGLKSRLSTIFEGHQQQAFGLQMAVRQRAGGRRQERQVGDGRGQTELEQGLGPSDVARLTYAQLHQAGDAMLHHLAPSSDFRKGRNWPAAHAPAGATPPADGAGRFARPSPACTGRARARGTRLGSKHKHAARLSLGRRSLVWP